MHLCDIIGILCDIIGILTRTCLRDAAPAVEQKNAKWRRMVIAAAADAAADTWFVPAAASSETFVCMGTIEIEGASAQRASQKTTDSHAEIEDSQNLFYLSASHLFPYGTSCELDAADAADAESIADDDDEAGKDDDVDNEDDGEPECKLWSQESTDFSCTICIRPGHLQA